MQGFYGFFIPIRILKAAPFSNQVGSGAAEAEELKEKDCGGFQGRAIYLLRSSWFDAVVSLRFLLVVVSFW